MLHNTHTEWITMCPAWHAYFTIHTYTQYTSLQCTRTTRYFQTRSSLRT